MTEKKRLPKQMITALGGTNRKAAKRLSETLGREIKEQLVSKWVNHGIPEDTLFRIHEGFKRESGPSSAYAPEPAAQWRGRLPPVSRLEVWTHEEYRERVNELEGPESYTAIPLISDPIAAGAGAVVAENNIEGFAIIYSDWVPAGRVTAVRVTGESMTPTLPEGSLIAVHHAPAFIEDGRLYCLYDRASEGAIVKRIRLTDYAGTYIVESDNPDGARFPPMVWRRDEPEEVQTFRMIGRVIWSWTRF